MVHTSVQQAALVMLDLAIVALLAYLEAVDSEGVGGRKVHLRVGNLLQLLTERLPPHLHPSMPIEMGAAQL